MKNQFPILLSTLRKKARFTNRELAEEADVPRSLIPSLQSGRRCVGEYQARKLGAALRLSGTELEDFVISAIDRCTEKVLKDVEDYPAQLINLLGLQLKKAGIQPESLSECSVNLNKDGCEVAIKLNDGSCVVLEMKLELAA